MQLASNDKKTNLRFKETKVWVL